MKRRFILTGLAIATLAVGTVSLAATKITLGHAAPAHRRIAIERIDHSVWDNLLQKYCDKEGWVDYRAWKQSRADQGLLDKYLAHLSQANPRDKSSVEAKLAFWINAYNAVTVKGILREYPTSSITNHTAKVFGYNIWKDLFLPVGDKVYSLEQIEHEILRKMDEPRIHFAIVCASISCPRLLNRAYVAKQLEEQLDVNTKDFFADPGKFRYDVAKNRLEVSKILNWFATDFGSNQAEQMRTISPFLPTQEARDLAASGKASVGYLSYDWGLNDQATRPDKRR